ncbi:MAG: type II toxin-antitoxin system RelE/ParE family toxin [Candidatus Binatia bacterium]
MRREIILAPEAKEDFKALKATDRAAVRDPMEQHLRYEPTKTSSSRIKRLRGMRRPQYRLRVEEVRVFYDVTAEAVEVLAIVAKSKAAEWLQRHGEPEKAIAEERGETKS